MKQNDIEICVKIEVNFSIPNTKTLFEGARPIFHMETDGAFIH